VDLASASGHQADLALAARCGAGDLSAFEEVYRAHAPRLYALACRMVGRSEAEDLLQEIFLAAHRKIGTFKGEASLATWLFRMAANLCVDFLRSRGATMAKRTESLDGFSAMPKTPNAGPILGVLDRLDLERALPLVPPGAREVFVLHDIEGLNHPEIAATLKMSVGSSKSQLHKARRRLRTLMAAGRRDAGAATPDSETE
jgi:RNA polymerase sigma-70 factor (ECF subfamily)